MSPAPASAAEPPIPLRPPAASSALRRGACPALSAPMPTGDGLLVRLSPISGGLSPSQLIGLCESAARQGNGVIEVTARGSLQFRGLDEASAPRFAAEVDRLGIGIRPPPAVEVGPLAGMDTTETADPRPLAERLRHAIAARGLPPKLAPKTAIVVDGGGAVPMDALKADVRLRAVRSNQSIVWSVTIGGEGGNERPVGAYDEADATGVALAALEAIAALSPVARGRDLEWADVSRLGVLAPPSVVERLASPADRIPLRDGLVALPVIPSFGTFDAHVLARVASVAGAAVIGDIRPAPGRMLLVICPDERTAGTLNDAAESLGLSTDRRAPIHRIVACPGAPACASGLIDTRRLAQAAAPATAPLLHDPELTVHVSGCPKGCAHPAASAVTLVGDENGVGLVVNGTARAAPVAYTAPEALAAALASLGRLVDSSRLPGEQASETLARLPPTRLAAAFTERR